MLYNSAPRWPCNDSHDLNRAGYALLRILALGFFTLYLSACAGGNNRPDMPVLQEEAAYRSHAQPYYAPPGPPEDPWGPYIQEASTRFDVPEAWIRAVIHQESGGHLYDRNGQFITSVPGAMGLMQLMPPTYDELKSQYSLGSDPYNPHDNILAGTAYIRQMYEIYGSPGFLAAYNYGPGSLDSYLKTGRALPRETRQYVANIGRRIKGVKPVNRSAADLLVAQYERARPVSHSRVAIRKKWRRNSVKRNGYHSQDVQVAQAPSKKTNAKKHPLRKASLKRLRYTPPAKKHTWEGSTAARPIPVGHHLKATPVTQRRAARVSGGRSRAQKTSRNGASRRRTR